MPHRPEHIIIYQHRDFRGHHRHIHGEEANLNDSEDDSLNDAVSSFAVLSGTWRFYRHSNFSIPYAGLFGPGEYTWVEDFGIENDQVSSLRAE